jgi:mannose-1-phosphate guanylyltransferase
MPKPVMPLAGRPFLTFMLDWAHSHGVDEVILSCGFMSDDVKRVLGDIYDGMRLRYVIEDEPLGTAGPVRLAYDEGLLDDRFFVLNGDVLTDIDLTAELAEHERSGARVTLALHPVEDTSSYGVVPTDSEGRVEAFLEKTEGEAPTNRINAGAYVVERDVVEAIPPGRAVSFEREIFPALVGEGLQGFPAAGYWIDIGTPERFLQANWDILERRVETSHGERIGEAVEIADSARLSDRAVIGSGTTIGEDVLIEESVLLANCRVGAGARIRGAILSAGVEVAPGAAIDPGAVVGEGELVEAAS